MIEDTINLSGVTPSALSTRPESAETNDTIESLGIERTFQKLRQASIVLWVIDLNTPAEQIEELAKVIIPESRRQKVILCFQQSDLLSSDELELKQQLLNNIPADRIYISAKQQENTGSTQAASDPGRRFTRSISKRRHRHKHPPLRSPLTKAHEAILRVINGLEMNISGDFLSQDIRECMHSFGRNYGTD